LMGESKISTGEGLIFNVTPSPGATTCLENAEIDLRTVVRLLGADFDEEGFARDLLDDGPTNDENATSRMLNAS